MSERTSIAKHELLPCVFCSGGDTQIEERNLPPHTGSVSIHHWCAPSATALSTAYFEHREVRGHNHQAALDAYNRRRVIA